MNLVLKELLLNITSAFNNPRLGISLDQMNVIKYISDLFLCVSAYQQNKGIGNSWREYEKRSKVRHL